MKPMRWSSLTVIFLGVWATSTLAGPNFGGALVVHTDDALEYSQGDNYVGQSGRNCANDFDPCPPAYDDVACASQGLDPTSDRPATGPTAQIVWWILAAFHPNTCPRVSAIAFGVSWDPVGAVTITEYGKAGDFEVSNEGWPGNLSGTALTWGTARRTHLFEVYWFSGYAYYGEATFRVGAHLTQPTAFADDTIPAAQDLIPAERRGSLGMNGATGLNPAPIDMPTPTQESSWGSIKHIFGTTGEE